jgi:RHS repeat-associated protein
MAGISDKAIKTNYAENKFRCNGGNELQNKEFADGTGIETYEAGFRTLDPQLGRFMQIDPMANRTKFSSPYAYVSNNPVNFNDPQGLYRFSVLKGSSTGWGGNEVDQEMDDADEANEEAMAEQGGGGGGSGGGNMSDFLNNVVSALMANGSGSTWTSNGDGTGTYDFADPVGGIDAGASDGPGNPFPPPVWTPYQFNGVNFDVSDQVVYGNIVQGSDAYYHGDIMRIGVNTSDLGNTSYQWIQDINQNDVGWSIDEPNFNGFYFPSGDSHLTTSIYASGAPGSYFVDAPGTTGFNNSFAAQTTLVGFDSQGIATPLLSVNWGYTANNGAVWSWPISFSATPNATTQAAINGYNATKNPY